MSSALEVSILLLAFRLVLLWVILRGDATSDAHDWARTTHFCDYCHSHWPPNRHPPNLACPGKDGKCPLGLKSVLDTVMSRCEGPDYHMSRAGPVRTAVGKVRRTSTALGAACVATNSGQKFLRSTVVSASMCSTVVVLTLCCRAEAEEKRLKELMKARGLEVSDEEDSDEVSCSERALLAQCHFAGRAKQMPSQLSWWR